MTTRMFHSLALAAMLAIPAAARAADAPTAAEVLPKLHQSNQREIEMGKMAEKNGQSKQVKAYGKALVDDHTAADKKVKALAKQEKIDLPAQAEPAAHEQMAPGPD